VAVDPIREHDRSLDPMTTTDKPPGVAVILQHPDGADVRVEVDIWLIWRNRVSSGSREEFTVPASFPCRSGTEPV
jgi:hypothetical protein